MGQGNSTAWIPDLSWATTEGNTGCESDLNIRVACLRGARPHAMLPGQKRVAPAALPRMLCQDGQMSLVLGDILGTLFMCVQGRGQPFSWGCGFREQLWPMLDPAETGLTELKLPLWPGPPPWHFCSQFL